VGGGKCWWCVGWSVGVRGSVAGGDGEIVGRGVWGVGNWRWRKCWGRTSGTVGRSLGGRVGVKIVAAAELG